jgi:hypothetical protein
MAEDQESKNVADDQEAVDILVKKLGQQRYEKLKGDSVI